MTLDAFKHLIGDLARPLSIIVTSCASAWAVVVLAHRIEPEGVGVAAFIGAVLAGLAGLYWGRSWENARTRPADPPAGG